MSALVIYSQQPTSELTKQTAEHLKVPVVTEPQSDADLIVIVEDDRVGIQLNQAKQNPFYVDFLVGNQAHRFRQGTEHSMLPKAFSLPVTKQPKVLDLTAGWGRDAYLLACQSIHVTLIERNPVIAWLLQNGIQRAREAQHPPSHFLELHQIDAFSYLNNLPANSAPDIAYLDPMFPKRRKSALVKKDMQLLQTLVTDHCDYAALFKLALKKAKYRVIVKHAKASPPFAGSTPTWQLNSKTIRFDIYDCSHMESR